MASDPKDEQVTTPPGAAARMAPIDAPAAVRERYEVLAEVGRGGMGVVYQARDRETGGEVALKVINPGLAADAAIVERFKGELLLARKITHKNVCRMYELLRFGDVVAIAMEYVAGETLRSVLARQQGVALERALEWTQQICGALAEAHAQGVVHRDLKPENVIIDAQGAAKVMDFGLAHSIDAEMTQTGAVSGTPAYMSPEQVEGKAVDARSDIYALGLMLFEMFTGRRAFQADSAVALAHKHVHEAPPRARSVNPLLPDFLDRVIARCLHKDPAKRFAAVAELQAALQEEAPAELETETDPEPPARLKTWTKWDGALVVLGILALTYFLGISDQFYPWSRNRLEIDALSARRTGLEIANGLGVRLDIPRTEMLFEPNDYVAGKLRPMLGRSPADPWQVSRNAEFPLQWRVWSADFSGAPIPDLSLTPLTMSDLTWVRLTRNGKLIELNAPPTPAGNFLPKYAAPAVEQRRALARSIAEKACGALPAELMPVETSGGRWGARYSATWQPVHPPDAAPIALVSMWAERPTWIRCYEREAPGSERNEEQEIAYGLIQRVMLGASRFGSVAILIGLLVKFGFAQVQRAKWFWKRVPLAVLMGLTGAWLLAPRTVPVPVAILLPALAAAALLVPLFGYVEHVMRRTAGGRIASFLQVLRGEVTHASVGMAVLRGAAAGAVLAALQMALVHLTLWRLGGAPRPISVLMLMGALPDGRAAGQAMVSNSPALYLAATALFGALSAVLFCGIAWVSAQKNLKQTQKLQGRMSRAPRYAVLAFGMVAMLFALNTAIESQFLAVMPAGIGVLFIPFGLYALVLLVFLAYDALTAGVAVGMSVLMTVGYPLNIVLSEIGSNVSAVYGVWGLVIAGAVVVSFREQVREWFANLRD